MRHVCTLLLIAASCFGPACRRADQVAGEGLPGPVVRGEVGERVDRALLQAADSGFNGSVLIAVDGRIVLHKGYGWADSESTEPVTTTTPFWIASISKQFAAAAILRLVEQGRVSLDDSITKFFPAAPPDKRNIAIHQLLTHTAGLDQHYAADGLKDRDEAVQSILGHPLGRQPGEGFAYSNDAYNLLAAVVEVAAGRPYEVFLREQLLKPAGLQHTGFWGPPDHPEVAAILHGEFAGSTVLEPNWGFRGGVGMFSTSGDLYRWYQALEGSKVLTRSSWDRLITPYVMRGTTGVGYGWFVSPAGPAAESVWTRGYESFGHGAVLATYPKERVIIIVTTNSGERLSGGPVSHALAGELAALVMTPP